MAEWYTVPVVGQSRAIVVDPDTLPTLQKALEKQQQQYQLLSSPQQRHHVATSHNNRKPSTSSPSPSSQIKSPTPLTTKKRQSTVETTTFSGAGKDSKSKLAPISKGVLNRQQQQQDTSQQPMDPSIRMYPVAPRNLQSQDSKRNIDNITDVLRRMYDVTDELDGVSVEPPSNEFGISGGFTLDGSLLSSVNMKRRSTVTVSKGADVSVQERELRMYKDNLALILEAQEHLVEEKHGLEEELKKQRQEQSTFQKLLEEEKEISTSLRRELNVSKSGLKDAQAFIADLQNTITDLSKKLQTSKDDLLLMEKQWGIDRERWHEQRRALEKKIKEAKQIGTLRHLVTDSVGSKHLDSREDSLSQPTTPMSTGSHAGSIFLTDPSTKKVFRNKERTQMTIMKRREAEANEPSILTGSFSFVLAAGFKLVRGRVTAKDAKIVSYLFKDAVEKCSGETGGKIIRLGEDAALVHHVTVVSAVQFTCKLQDRILNSPWPSWLNDLHRDFAYQTSEVQSSVPIFSGLRVSAAILTGDVQRVWNSVSMSAEYNGDVVQLGMILAGLCPAGLTIVPKDIRDTFSLSETTLAETHYPWVCEFGVQRILEEEIQLFAVLPQHLRERCDLLIARKKVLGSQLLGERPTSPVVRPQTQNAVKDGMMFAMFVRMHQVDVIRAGIGNVLWNDVVHLYVDTVTSIISQNDGVLLLRNETCLMIVFETSTVAMTTAFALHDAMMSAPWPQSVLQQPSCQKVELNGSVMFQGPRLTIGLHYCVVSVKKDPFFRNTVCTGEELMIADDMEAVALPGETVITQSVLDELGESLVNGWCKGIVLVPLGKLQVDDGKSNMNSYLVQPPHLRARLRINNDLGEPSQNVIDFETELNQFTHQVLDKVAHRLAKKANEEAKKNIEVVNVVLPVSDELKKFIGAAEFIMLDQLYEELLHPTVRKNKPARERLWRQCEGLEGAIMASHDIMFRRQNTSIGSACLPLTSTRQIGDILRDAFTFPEKYDLPTLVGSPDDDKSSDSSRKGGERGQRNGNNNDGMDRASLDDNRRHSQESTGTAAQKTQVLTAKYKLQRIIESEMERSKDESVITLHGLSVIHTMTRSFCALLHAYMSAITEGRLQMPDEDVIVKFIMQYRKCLAENLEGKVKSVCGGKCRDEFHALIGFAITEEEEEARAASDSARLLRSTCGHMAKLFMGLKGFAKVLKRQQPRGRKGSDV